MNFPDFNEKNISFLTQYKELSGFLKNGRYEINNGWVERVIRKLAIGRNSWMFSDTVEGAKAFKVMPQDL